MLRTRRTQFQFSAMAMSMSVHFFTVFVLVLLFFRPSMASPNSTLSFSFKHFSSKDSSFTSQIALHGDSKLVASNGGSVQLTSSGRVIFKKPIKLVEGKPRKTASFSMRFSFSLHKGQSLAFVMLPFNNASSKAKIVKVKFVALDESRIHGGIEVLGLVSARSRNASTVDLALRNGTVSSAWVDYEASSKRLEVRLSESQTRKPSDPLFWYPIDLSVTWQNDQALLGFTANSSATIHSWSFEQRRAPEWMHSQPLDPKRASDDGLHHRHSKPLKIESEKKEKRNCVSKILGSLVLGLACGASLAFLGMYLWSVLGKKRPVVPEESVEFEYKKVVVDNKVIEDDGK